MVQNKTKRIKFQASIFPQFFKRSDSYPKFEYFIGYIFIFSLVILKLFVTKGFVLFTNLKNFEVSYSDLLELFLLLFRIIRKLPEDNWRDTLINLINAQKPSSQIFWKYQLLVRLSIRIPVYQVTSLFLIIDNDGSKLRDIEKEIVLNRDLKNDVMSVVAEN